MTQVYDNFIDVNENDVYIAEGDRGTGKNLLAMDIILQALRENKDIHIYSIFPLQNMGKYEKRWTKISYHRLLRDWTTYKRPCLLVLDEIHVLADSRDPFNKAQYKEYTKLFTQLRKRGMTVIGLTQDIAMLDVRIRRQTNFLIKCRKEVISEYIETSQGDVIKKYDNYIYLLFQKIGRGGLKPVNNGMRATYEDIKKGNYYDTNYIVEFYDELDRENEESEE